MRERETGSAERWPLQNTCGASARAQPFAPPARLALIASTAIVILLLAPLAWCVSAPDDLADPVPLRRVLITPEQLPGEMERVQQRVLVQLPRAEFEELVRKAAKASAPRNGPRLIEARYRATLVDNGGLAGTGQWKVIHPGAGAALLPLQPLNVALQKPRFENREALVADFDGKTPALLVEEPGEHSVAIEWSARADARPEGLYFALELPAAPVTTLELDLPADREASVGGSAVLSGPFPSEAADRRVWKIACGGRPGVNLWVRRTATTSGPAVFVRQHNVQTLLPEGVNATFRLDLEVTQPGVRLVVCEIDPDLRVVEVVAANLEKSDLRPGAAGAPAQLFLTLRESLPVGPETIQIRCLAPLGVPLLSPAAPREGRAVNWTSPAVRLANVGFQADKVEPAIRVVPRGETLELRCHPDIRLEDWQPGGFRLTEAGPRSDTEPIAAFQALTLQGGGVGTEGAAAAKGPRRPSARLHVGGVDFRARQAAWWQIADDRMTLTLQITYEVNQGQLLQLPVQLPSEWDVERVELNPATLLRNWNVRKDKNRSVLLVDLLRPVTATDDFRRDKTALGDGVARLHGPTLTIRLNSVRRENLDGKALPFPDAVPVGARLREGVLAVDFSGLLYDGSVTPPLPESSAAEEDGPWGTQTPDHFYPYRGQSPQAVLQLRKRTAQLRARCTTDVYLAADRVDTRLVLEAEAGSVDAVELYLSAPAADGSKWRVEAGATPLRQVERLYTDDVFFAAALAGAQSWADAADALAARRSGEHWRLTFTRPLRGHNPLVLHASQPLSPHGGRWEAPLPVLVNAARMEGEVVLHLGGTNRLALETAGLREVVPASPAVPGNRGSTAWRTFRYGAGEGVLLRGPVPPQLGSTAVVVERADLTTFVQLDGSLEHRFSFRLTNWHAPTLALTLPWGCRPLDARVDTHWLPRPSLLYRQRGDGLSGVVLELPVPTNAEGSHRFEVAYAADGEPWSLWTRAESLRPRLPAEPLAYRHVWRLPPGVCPLNEANYRRLPGPGEGFEPVDPRRWSPGAAHDFQLPPWSAPGRDPAAGHRQALADAVQAVRRGHAGQTLPLAEIAERVAGELARERRAFVLDWEALQAGDITPQTPLEVKPLAAADDVTAPWDGLGLITVPARTGVLLTTDRQLRSWREAAPVEPLSDAVIRAIDEAATQGQDGSGRFAAALVGRWPVSARGQRPGASEDRLAEWTAWEALPGTGADTSLLVVRGEKAARSWLSMSVIVGLGLVPVLGLCGWHLRTWGRWRLVPLLGWLAFSGLGVLFLPTAFQFAAWGPLIAGGLVFCLWYLSAAVLRRPVPVPAVRVAAVASGVCALLLGAIGPAGRAAPPAPPVYTVFLVPGPADAPEKQTVLAPTELIDLLQALARPALGAGPVLLSASYEGKVAEDVADFDATYFVQCLTDEPTTLLLPLDGVQLHGEVWLDGAPARPVALAAPQVGYGLAVRDRGRHKVELHFRVPVTGTAEDRNVQFTVPRLAQNHLRLKLPGDATYVQALVKHGAQRRSVEAGLTVFDVDLGRVGVPLHLHWSQAALPPRPAKVSFREAYLWDLRVDAPSLSALLHYDIADGPVTALTVLLPAELEVRGAEARRPAGTDGGGVVRLRDWKVDAAANPRVLTLRFANPVRGEVQVQLDLVPAAPLPATVTLPLPTPQGTPKTDASYLAYRVQGLDAVRTNWLRVRGVPFADFAPFWPPAARPESTAVADAYTFRREGNQGPVLTLKLRPQTVVRATQEVVVRLGSQQARVQAALDLKAPNNDLTFVEWEIASSQPFTVAAVTGTDVRGWTQTNGRVQVWLDHATKETHLELSGWCALAADNKRLRLELPTLRVTGVQSQQTAVRLSAGTGLAFLASQPRSMTPSPQPPPGEQELAYQTDQLNYGGTFYVQPAAAGPDAQVFTLVEVRDGRLSFLATVDYSAPNSDLRTVNIRLSDWEGEEVRLDAPRVAQRRERRHAPDDRSWTLELQSGATGPARPAWSAVAGPGVRFAARPTAAGHYRCTLSGTVALADAAGGVRMPHVTVAGAGPVQYFLAVAGKDLTPDTPVGLTPLTTPAQYPAAWKDELQRLRPEGGTAWKVVNGDWRLRLTPRAGLTEPGPVVVYLTECTAAVADQKRWLHEGVYTFRHEAGAELNLTLPDGVRVLSAALDGAPVAHAQLDTRRIGVPLPGRAGVRRLHLRWAYDDGRESLTAPDLDRPRLTGARDGPVLYALVVSPGLESTGTPGLEPGLVRAATLDAEDAAAQLALSIYLAGQGAAAIANDPAPLVDAQKRFAAACRRADRALEAVGDPADSEKRLVAERLQTLQASNREQARRLGYDAIRTEAEGQGGVAVRTWPSEPGQVLYAATPPDGSVPRVVLQVTHDRHQSRTLLAATGWLLLLAFIGLLASVRGLVAAARLFWPEQVALLGAAGWVVGGPTLLAVLLALAGVGARAAYGYAATRRLVARATVAEKKTATGSSGNRSGT